VQINTVKKQPAKTLQNYRFLTAPYFSSYFFFAFPLFFSLFHYFDDEVYWERCRYRKHTFDFKLKALARLDAGEGMRALARNLEIVRIAF
jgi:hypothetical protein